MVAGCVASSTSPSVGCRLPLRRPSLGHLGGGCGCAVGGAVVLVGTDGGCDPGGVLLAWWLASCLVLVVVVSLYSQGSVGRWS
jgi:hypothetical protein